MYPTVSGTLHDSIETSSTPKTVYVHEKENKDVKANTSPVSQLNNLSLALVETGFVYSIHRFNQNFYSITKDFTK